MSGSHVTMQVEQEVFDEEDKEQARMMMKRIWTLLVFNEDDESNKPLQI